MPPRMSLPQALSILHAQAAKHDTDLLVDVHLAEVARHAFLGILPGFLPQDLAEAITVAWSHASDQVQDLECFVVEATGDRDKIRIVEEEDTDE